MITHDDWLNLINLYEGKKAFWTREAFLRCKEYLSGDSFSLSPAGMDKVQRLIEGIGRLKAGVPLSQRTSNRRDDATKEQWLTIWRKEEPIQLTKSCLILGKTRGIKAPEAPNSVKSYFSMWLTNMNRKETHWRKAIPYAVQIDGFGGTEVICLHSLDKKEFWRIKSTYYDLIIERFPNATWWVRWDGSMGIGAKIISSKKEWLGQGVLAIVLPFDTSKSTIDFPNPNS